MRDSSWDSMNPAGEPRRWPTWATVLLVVAGVLAVVIGVMASIARSGRQEAWPLYVAVEARLRDPEQARTLFERNVGLQDRYGSFAPFEKAVLDTLQTRSKPPQTAPRMDPERYWVSSRATQIVVMHRAEGQPWLVVVLDRPGLLGRAVLGDGLRLVFTSTATDSFMVLREGMQHLRMAQRQRAANLVAHLATEEGLKATLAALPNQASPELANRLRALRPDLAAFRFDPEAAKTTFKISRHITPIREEETVHVPLNAETLLKISHVDGRLAQLTLLPRPLESEPIKESR